jgi:hypothetical protein
MPFASYTSIEDVAQAHQITLRQEDFVVPLQRPVSEVLRGELAFTRAHVAFDISEAAICESLIVPVLKEVWKDYTDDLMFWSHIRLDYDPDSSETPDYLIARMSPLGRWVVDKPYLLIVEAEKEDSIRGWGQCLAAMLAAQKLNQFPEQTVYGITSTGRFWEFGKLEGTVCTRNQRPYILEDLEQLCAALHYVFDQCRQQLVGQPCSA